ncbi:HNH endonuclease [uncultured Veillonella sp.]|jgi:5-methylcytosine-specific restriction endonuclease McrA|uniref:HNH endonuclease n=2 Tax=uncultured Veillonella sp. TaxID=159268 RepID=UPI0020486DFB|nr:MAG TPA: HNHc [Caudoviricetes sp.]
MLKRTPLRAKKRMVSKKPLSKKSRNKKKNDMELEKIRPKVIERDHRKCILCGAPYEEIHHIKYRSAGGKNNIENLCCLCWHCHRVKIHSGAHPKEYRKALQGILKERHGYEY